MVGASINIPIQIGSRDAASDEARARLAESRAKLEELTNEVSVEIEQSRLHADQAGQVARLYVQRLLPAAQAQIDAAVSAFQAGRGSFLALIDAERTLRRTQLQHHEAIADTHRSNAALVRAIGRGRPSRDSRRTP